MTPGGRAKRRLRGGARIVFDPTFGMHDERNRSMMRTRSYESELYIGFTYPLESLLTGPQARCFATIESRRQP